MKENMKLLFYRPYKLILSIFLSALIVASVAISSVSFTTNSKEKAKEELWKYVDKYISMEGRYDEEDRINLQNELNLASLPIYDAIGVMQPFVTVAIDLHYLKNREITDEEVNININIPSISFVDDMKFENDIEFVYGDSFPKEGEVAISELHLEFFKKMGYINSEKNIKNFC